MFSKEIHILVVDDSTPMRQLIKNILIKLGYERIFEAKDGEMALEVLREKNGTDEAIELVLSDINMPVKNGLELVGDCHKDPDLNSVPFIMVTTDAERDTVLKAVMAGVKGYIMKPFSAVDVEAQLEKVYEKIGS